MNKQLDLAYKKMEAKMEARYRELAPIREAAKLKQRRGQILEAINNKPNSFEIGSAFEGFLMCFPHVRMNVFLRLKERVIYKRVMSYV